MLTLLRITEQLFDSESSPTGDDTVSCGGDTVLCNDDHMNMSNYGHSGGGGGGDNYPQHKNHHRHHRPHHGCSACLDKKPILNKSMKAVSFGADEEFLVDDDRPVKNRTGDQRLDVADSTENRRAVGGTIETSKLRSWISVVGDINELSSEPERDISGIPHKDHHHRQLTSPTTTTAAAAAAAASARKRRERNRSIPTDGPAMTDLGSPLAKPRRNSDGATIIRRFLVTPVEDTHDDFFDDMSPPPLPKTPPPSEPSSLVFIGECPVESGPCARPSILKKSHSTESAPKSILRSGTFTLHTNNGGDTHGIVDGTPRCSVESDNKAAGDRTELVSSVAAAAKDAEESNNHNIVSDYEKGFKAKLRSNVDHEIVRGPENRLPTSLKSGISESKLVSIDEWLGDRGVDFDPVKSPTRTTLRRSISEASGLRQKKVSFDLEHVDVFPLEQELISDEQSAYLNERFRQYLGDSGLRDEQGSPQQKEGETTTSLEPGCDATATAAAADGAIVDDNGGKDDNGIELVKKTITDDDKTWLKT